MKQIATAEELEAVEVLSNIVRLFESALVVRDYRSGLDQAVQLQSTRLKDYKSNSRLTHPSVTGALTRATVAESRARAHLKVLKEQLG